MVNKKFLKETGFKTVEHTKLETQTYDLTLKSIFFVLWKEMGYADTEKWDYKFIDNVIRKYNSLLPLIFGKWRHFARMKVEKIAFFRLKVLVDTYAKDPLSFERGTGFLPGMDTKQLVCWFFYFQFRHFKYSEVWMTALEQDEEIRAYIIKELRAYQKRLENLNVLLEKNIAFLEK